MSMTFQERKLPGVYEITFHPHTDKRGFFMRVFDDATFKERGLVTSWVQESHSRSVNKGIVRGLHFQLPPFTETKLIRVISGTVWDVFLDLRFNSPTFGQWDAMELSSENHKAIYLPRGLAHGFCTLSEQADMIYKMDNVYQPRFESGIIWNDPDIGISWPVSNIQISERDSRFCSFKEFREAYPHLQF